MSGNPRVGQAPPRGRLARAETISSAENRWIKLFRAALRGSGLSKEGWVGVEGARLVEEALRSGLEAPALLVSTSGERHLERLAPLLISADDRGAEGGTKILQMSDRLFAAIAGTETPQGVAALIRPRSSTFDDLLRGDVPLVVVLVCVQDPGNVGTTLRSAEAFGATGAVATRGTAYPWAPKSLRASAGSVLRLPILTGIAPPVALAQLRVVGLKLFAASVESTGGTHMLSPAEADLRGPTALLVGNEGAGLPPEVERSADERVRIPLASPVDSLNAAVAASVLLYEAARQRACTI